MFKIFHNMYISSESREILRVIEDTICKRCRREWIDYFLTSMIMLDVTTMPKARLRVISSLINVPHYF